MDNEASALAARLKDKCKLSSTYKDLSKIYAAAGDFKNAYKNLEIGRNLYQDMYAQDATSEHDPKFVDFAVTTFDNATAAEEPANEGFSAAFDFHLQAGSPALTGGNTNFSPYNANALSAGGKTYTSPVPSVILERLDQINNFTKSITFHKHPHLQTPKPNIFNNSII